MPRPGLGIGEVEAERSGVTSRGDDLLEKLRRFVVAAVGVGAIGGVEIAVRMDEKREKEKGENDKAGTGKRPQSIGEKIHGQAV